MSAMQPNEQAVARIDELQDGQMKEVAVGEKKVLLARVNSQFYAVGAECPHYGAPLAEGVLCGDRLVCPWHKSCFRVTDGALLEPPALDGLPRYPVRVADGQVFVILPDPAPEPPKPPTVLSTSDDRRMVIIGAGAAGIAAAEALRFFGFEGRIEMIGYEGELPYDRPNLSKGYLSGKSKREELPLRSRAFYEEQRVDHIVRRVTQVDVDSRQIQLDDGPSLTYTALLLATGGVPRRLDVPGADLGNIFLLRSEDDASHILDASPAGARAVIIGGSFIGLEVASCFAARQIPVTVVAREETPFADQFGPEIGRRFQRLHEDNGVSFRLSSEVDRFEGSAVVREVVLRSGARLPAEIVVVGVGVRPNTDFIQGVPKHHDGGVIVDRYLRAVPDVYAAGDIAVFPEPRSQRPVRIEHWRVALQHGRVAAANMAGRAQPYEGVPYFWTEQQGSAFDYLGYAKNWDDIILQGDTTKPEFLAFYVENDRVAAAAGSGRDRDMAALHELMRLNRVPAPEQIRRGVDLLELLQSSVRAAAG
jgi:apoptosis-inducing factor 3